MAGTTKKTQGMPNVDAVHVEMTMRVKPARYSWHENEQVLLDDLVVSVPYTASVHDLSVRALEAAVSAQVVAALALALQQLDACGFAYQARQERERAEQRQRQAERDAERAAAEATA